MTTRRQTFPRSTANVGLLKFEQPVALNIGAKAEWTLWKANHPFQHELQEMGKRTSPFQTEQLKTIHVAVWTSRWTIRCTDKCARVLRHKTHRLLLMGAVRVSISQFIIKNCRVIYGAVLILVLIDFHGRLLFISSTIFSWKYIAQPFTFSTSCK